MAGRLSEISAAECQSLLADRLIGRVAWVADDGMQVLPVNFVVIGGQIVFRTKPGTLLAGLVMTTDVVFESDDVDEFSATGWSVVVRGRSGPFVGELLSVDLNTWAPGRNSVVIAITPTSITGRAVAAD